MIESDYAKKSKMLRSSTSGHVKNQEFFSVSGIPEISVISEYDLELERAIKTIRSEKAKLVALQFPDGLKNKAIEVANEIEKSTGAKCLIWMGSCFGACDVPQPSAMSALKIDLVIQWGHSGWPFRKEGKKGIEIVK
ncbi:MAG: diphthamide synthesis protein [Nanoarchaeota archaeon]|nr:diphthamide synthesis protein [Nanoarchaeota archaeon]